MRSFIRKCLDLFPVISTPRIMRDARPSVRTCHEEALSHAIFVYDAIVLQKGVESVGGEARELSHEL